jgi:hypothetical protein
LRDSCSLTPQSSILNPLHVRDQIVPGRIVIRDPGPHEILQPLVEGSRPGIIRATCRLDDDQPGPARYPALHLFHHGTPDAVAVPLGGNDDPVDVEGPERAGRLAPANPAGQDPVQLDARGLIVGVPAAATTNRGVEDLERYGDLVGPEYPAVARHGFDLRAVPLGQRPDHRRREDRSHAGTFWVMISAARALSKRCKASSTTRMISAP